MKDITLGTVPEEALVKDAIHVAIISMVAGELLRPGQRVSITAPGWAGTGGKIVGIVDPYLQDVVPKGSKFWMCLLPNTVTGMKHHWEHPAFEEGNEGDNKEKLEAIAFLRRVAENFNLEYEDIVSEDFALAHGHFINKGEDMSWQENWYAIHEEFWKARELVTGVKVDEYDRGGFSCAC